MKYGEISLMYFTGTETHGHSYRPVTIQSRSTLKVFNHHSFQGFTLLTATGQLWFCMCVLNRTKHVAWMMLALQGNSWSNREILECTLRPGHLGAVYAVSLVFPRSISFSGTPIHPLPLT